MADHVSGKVVVITGAASGFGRLVSVKAGARGARIVSGDFNAAGLAETAAQVAAAGGEIATTVTDVRRLADMRALSRTAVERFGAIDVMVNNAGTMPLGFYADHAAATDAWDRCIDINFKGVLHGILAVHDQMIAQGRGHVINLSSIYGNFPVIGAAVYGATKVAVDFLSESLRMESRGKIRVTIVKPTGVPGTNLGSGIINVAALAGIYGPNAPTEFARNESFFAGQLPAAEMDPERIKYFALAPEFIADAILHAID